MQRNIVEKIRDLRLIEGHKMRGENSQRRHLAFCINFQNELTNLPAFKVFNKTQNVFLFLIY